MTEVALVHDYLTQRGGAERVVLAMHEALPEAPIHTSLYEAAGTFPAFARADIRVSALDRIGPLRRNHRVALPLLAPAVSAMRVDADVVVCSSSGWAHGVRTDGAKIVYCHAPARWLYQREAYLARSGAGTSAALRVLDPMLRRWDRRAAATADRYLANSTRTQELIRATYGIDAEVLFPPHGVDPSGPQRSVDGVEPGSLLCVSRLLAYKNVDAVLGAMRDRRDDHLVVVGAGPDADRLRSLAPPNVTFLTGIDDDQLRWLYAASRALVAASYEDFGLTPIEAAAFGKPSIVLHFGGYLDTVVDGRTGLHFEAPDARAIGEAVDRLDREPLDADVIRSHAARFSPERFAEALRAVVDAARPAGSVVSPAMVEILLEVPELLAPLHPIRSVVAPTARARYTEVAGVAVLCDVDDRSLHELTPAGAFAWGLLDGRRTMADVRTELGFVDLDLPYDPIIELVRRLRADGLVRDVSPSTPPPPMETSEPSLPVVRIAATVTEAPGASSQGSALVFDRSTDGDDTEATDVDLVELTPDPDGVRADDQLLTRLADPPIAANPTDLAVATLARLVQAAVAEDLRAPGGLDLLAALAEQLTVT